MAYSGENNVEPWILEWRPFCRACRNAGVAQGSIQERAALSSIPTQNAKIRARQITMANYENRRQRKGMIGRAVKTVGMESKHRASTDPALHRGAHAL